VQAFYALSFYAFFIVTLHFLCISHATLSPPQIQREVALAPGRRRRHQQRRTATQVPTMVVECVIYPVPTTNRGGDYIEADGSCTMLELIS
ncbi:hypothetical protein M8C21_005639, partial [Ambrosia artemisiifolia]